MKKFIFFVILLLSNVSCRDLYVDSSGDTWEIIIDRNTNNLEFYNLTHLKEKLSDTTYTLDSLK